MHYQRPKRPFVGGGRGCVSSLSSMKSLNRAAKEATEYNIYNDSQVPEQSLDSTRAKRWRRWGYKQLVRHTAASRQVVLRSFQQPPRIPQCPSWASRCETLVMLSHKQRDLTRANFIPSLEETVGNINGHRWVSTPHPVRLSGREGG